MKMETLGNGGEEKKIRVMALIMRVCGYWKEEFNNFLYEKASAILNLEES